MSGAEIGKRQKLGPWAASDSEEWAGKLDWKQHPSATMRVKNLVITGCATS